MPQSTLPISETLPPTVRVHVLGAGPVGLAVAALLQSNDRLAGATVAEPRTCASLSPRDRVKVVRSQATVAWAVSHSGTRSETPDARVHAWRS